MQEWHGTVRIFVLGASTVIGFPNPYHTAFPSFLKLMLADVAEDVRVEIINCGMTAINSFSLLDFMDEVVEYEPDLVILYAGHNEFVGPYGVTTPFLRFGNDWRGIRLYMLLQRSRLYYCLKQLISAAREGKLEVVKSLLAEGADIDHQGRFKITALWQASLKGHKEIALYLINQGANPNVNDLSLIHI